jgi:hypothetical protein
VKTVLDQRAPFNWRNWNRYLEDETPAKVAAAIRAVRRVAMRDPGRRLRRRHVFDLWKKNPVSGVIATIMWGYPTGRRPGGGGFAMAFQGAPALAAAIGDLRRSRPTSHQICRRLGGVRTVGPSTYTKIAYFGGLRAREGRCLIYDQMVLRAIASSQEPVLAPLKQVLLARNGAPRKVVPLGLQQKTYGAYLKVATRLAKRTGRSPDEVELDLYMRAPRRRPTRFR